MISDDYELNIIAEESDKLTYAWKGGKLLANSQELNDLLISKKTYEEHGHSICKKKFDLFEH